MTASPLIELVDEPGDELQQTIQNGVRSYNLTLFPKHPDGKDIALAVRCPDSQVFVGGLLGRMAGGWLAIELLFVPESLRGKGLASSLIAMAEEKARGHGCHSAWIDTLNPKARQLYERLGYVVFGELENYPVGSSRYFLEKKLAPVPSE
jgi:GNAT superfamily N-acetyltransferase